MSDSYHHVSNRHLQSKFHCNIFGSLDSPVHMRAAQELVLVLVDKSTADSVVLMVVCCCKLEYM